VERRDIWQDIIQDFLVYLLAPDAIPVHASAVSINGHGVLFCGDPGSGKSSLGAIGLKKYELVSDDFSWATNEGLLTGFCNRIRLYPELLKGFFPNLEPEHFRIGAGRKIEIPIGAGIKPKAFPSSKPIPISCIVYPRSDEHETKVSTELISENESITPRPVRREWWYCMRFLADPPDDKIAAERYARNLMLELKNFWLTPAIRRIKQYRMTFSPALISEICDKLEKIV